MRRLLAAYAACGISVLASAQSIRAVDNRLEITEDPGKLTIQALVPDVLRIDFLPKGVIAKPTEIMDPKGLRRARPIGRVEGHEVVTTQLKAALTSAGVTIGTVSGKNLVTILPAGLVRGTLRIRHKPGENLYGMRGIALNRNRDPRLTVANGLLRNDGAPVLAGSQGDGGAPLTYTSNWGLLIDSVDGQFKTAGDVLEFSGGSRKDIEAYIVIGPPKRTIEVATELTGPPPLPPKWALGFMNSQWGTDEKMVTDIVDEYRLKRIPLDAFIFDFDFKAWGEDNYGEWRWNSTDGPGNVGSMKYPNGQSGKFGKQMAAKGVHLVGIMKPRVLTQTVDLKPTMAAKVADEHNWWMPGKKPYTDYFSHRLANDFDFSKPDLRKWYWGHAKNLFDTGISGWWNDEADDGFNSLGFFHMQQSLYEGQESVSNRRVWSLNRNFYLGAQRFAFGTWSGDIRTGFNVMADQRARMLAMVDLGQPHWSMDTGGFNGHPGAENYARWMEFAAMVPIMRVHGTHGERRQPWVYGPVAEAAATNAIDWRYKMFPSLYSWEHYANRTGVGIVRPLNWEFPDDPNCANRVDSWMMGDGLLVSPIVEQGQRSKAIYLPPGNWFDYKSDKPYAGQQTLQISTDPDLWLDMPMFVRSGTILATQPVQQYQGEKPLDELTLDIWLDESRPAQFEVYDDDGETRNYEHGVYFSQNITATKTSKGVSVEFSKVQGTYQSPIYSYLVRIHGMKLDAHGKTTIVPNVKANNSAKGDAIEVVIPAGVPTKLVLQ